MAAADTIQLSVGELTDALDNASADENSVERLVLEKIEAALQRSPVSFSDGGLFYTDTIDDRVVEEGCNNTTVQRLTTNVFLNDDTQILITLESLFDPVVIVLELAANIDAVGRARQNFGVRLGSCVELASDSFSFTAAGPLSLNLELSINLNPVWLDANTLQLTPVITLTGELRDSRVVVNVDDSILRSLLEDFLQDQVDELLSAEAIAEELASLQQNVQMQLQESIGQGDADGSLIIELPAESDDQIAALYALLTPQARFPLTSAFLRMYRLPLLAALITGDDQQITELLSNAAECELGGALQIPLPRPLLYSSATGVCAETQAPATAGRYFDNPSCDTAFEYAPMAMAEFCAVALDKDRLGNGFSDLPPLGSWAWSAGSAFELGVLSLAGKSQPMVQRSVYKTVATAGGECSLEMRVYKPSPNTQNLKALIALHGGSWQRRGTGFLGIEHMATHFTEAGFVVFAPFYRLIGNQDGTEACHDATLQDIESDTNDAMDWVQRNQARFGAEGSAVLFGQSAGGHLALSLAVNRPTEVAAAVLFYAPTDFADFAAQVRAGEYNNEQGQSIIEAVTATSIDNIDASSELIASNSFPSLIVENPSGYPPVYMLHGKSDSLLPARQSVRLCNALAGNIDNGPASLSGADLRSSFQCDSRGSELHLIAEGEHTLDLCLSESLCLAGSVDSAGETARVLDRMLAWAASPEAIPPLNAAPSGGSGALSVYWLLWMVFSVGVTKKIRTV